MSSSAHDEASVTQTCRESIRFDFDPPWEEIGCQTDDIGALAQRKLRSDAAYQCLAWTHFIFCGVLHFLIQQWTFATHHLSHRFVTHHLSLTTFTHTIFHTPSLTHTSFSSSHTIFHIPLCHTHNSSHTTCFTSRSSTTSFVFPSFPVPATTFVAHYWKKLTCGVIRSFNCWFIPIFPMLVG